MGGIKRSVHRPPPVGSLGLGSNRAIGADRELIRSRSSLPSLCSQHNVGCTELLETTGPSGPLSTEPEPEPGPLQPVRNRSVRQAQPAGGRGESGGHQAHGGQPSAQEPFEIVEIADAAVDDRRLDTAGVRMPASR